MVREGAVVYGNDNIFVRKNINYQRAQLSYCVGAMRRDECPVTRGLKGCRVEELKGCRVEGLQG